MRHGQPRSQRRTALVQKVPSDCLWLGHFDLTNSLGIPGQFDNPIYMTAVKRIVAAGRGHGKALGFMAAGADLAKQYQDLVFNMIATGTDAHGARVVPSVNAGGAFIWSSGGQEAAMPQEPGRALAHAARLKGGNRRIAEIFWVVPL